MVKRYTLGRSPAYGLENNIREFDMVESAHGEYVGLHDYRALAERCERLEAEVIELSWSLWSVMDGMQDHDIHAYTGLVDADCERIAASRRKAQELSLRRQEEESQ